MLLQVERLQAKLLQPKRHTASRGTFARICRAACLATLLLLAAIAHAAPGHAAAGQEEPQAQGQAALGEAFEAPGAAGLLEFPPGHRERLPVVMILLDAVGVDGRTDRYVEQLLGAGIAVLELREAQPGGAAEARAALARDPRIDAARIGALGFGEGARVALALPEGVAARALLYPGCATLPDPGGAVGALLLMHGGSDPANPVEVCAAASRRLASFASVMRHRTYADAGQAWDVPGLRHGASFLLPAAGSETRLRVRPWPELADVSAAEVSGFFAIAFAAGAR